MTLLKRKRQQPTAGTAMTTAKSTIDPTNPKCSELAVRSPTAVPRANVNDTVSDVREPVRKDLAELQNTLLEAKQLLAEMQVLVRANDYKIDDTIENMRTATQNLDELTDSVKQRPWSLIRIKQPEDRKMPK